MPRIAINIGCTKTRCHLCEYHPDGFCLIFSEHLEQDEEFTEQDKKDKVTDTDCRCVSCKEAEV